MPRSGEAVFTAIEDAGAEIHAGDATSLPVDDDKVVALERMSALAVSLPKVREWRAPHFDVTVLSYLVVIVLSWCPDHEVTRVDALGDVALMHDD